MDELVLYQNLQQGIKESREEGKGKKGEVLENGTVLHHVGYKEGRQLGRQAGKEG